VPLPGPRLPHDMMFTENFAILNDFPLHWDESLLAQGKHKLSYFDQKPSRFAVVPRRHAPQTGVKWFEASPTYVLHWLNAWEEGDEIVLDMAPGIDLFEELRRARTEQGRQAIHTVLGHFIPKRLAQLIADLEGASGPIGDFSDKRLRVIANAIKDWHVKPVGSEGYRTAEVTLGGVDTRDLESRTLEAKEVKGLYFIGEVVDVTGWLGGYNFQWAWASGWSAGQTV
jgi:predicted Rossmann fold flavoprotein